MRADAKEENEENCGCTVNQKDHVWLWDQWVRKYRGRWLVVSTDGKPTSTTSSENTGMVHQSDGSAEGEWTPRN